MLELARSLAKRTVAHTTDLTAIIEATATAYAPGGSLAIAFRTEWLGTTNNKTAQLALAWAREQVRLALAEILARARGERVLRAAGDTDTLAWLWLAACEALAQEPASAVPDRVHALVSFLTEGAS